MSLLEALVERFPGLASLPRDSYVVGGAIRDLLLDIEPADVDIACIDPLVSAKTIRSRVIKLGTEEHLSAWRVVDDDLVYDFAGILDGEIFVDLARRDFTMNAMAVSLGDGRLLDPHGGRRDLEHGIVRMVDAANFDDDPLRCLKGVRMAVKFGFQIDETTVAAIRTRARRIVDIAPERVTYELSLILSFNAFPRAIELLHATLLDVPLFGRDLAGENWRRPSLGSSSAAPRAHQAAMDRLSLAGAYALLVEDPKEYAKRWRWSTGLLRQVTALRELKVRHDRIALFDAGESIVRQLPAVLRALGREAELDLPDFNIRPLLTGDEIGSLARAAAGPEVGRLKRAMLEAQIRGDIETRDDAIAFVSASARP